MKKFVGMDTKGKLTKIEKNRVIKPIYALGCEFLVDETVFSLSSEILV